MIYDKLGPPFLRLVVTYVRRRYRRQIRAGMGLVAVGVGIAVYLAGRDVPEG